MRRLLLVVVVLAMHLSAAAPALADKSPDAAQVRQAAEQFDAGVAAYKEKDFEGAASRFEAADAAVPSAKALRQAIRARLEAGQGSRAATLAALAIDRYPSDDVTAKLAKETLVKIEPQVHKLIVSCASPCVLALGTRSIPGEPSTRRIVYIDPGKASLSVSFFGNAGGQRGELVAVPGGSSELRFEPEEKNPPPPVSPLVLIPSPAKDPPVVKDAPKPRSGISPVVFAIGAVATAGLGGVTLWSAIDTNTNPGPDAVRRLCAGKGEQCPAYQEGRSKQTRTNILIGATAGAAALTTVFAIFTRWRDPKTPRSDPTIAPTALITGRDVVLGAAGTF